MRKREIGFSLRLSEEELEQVRQLAYLQDRSINSYIRSLIRQAVSKTTIEVPKRTKKQEAAEYV
jgi:predicted HicB family RNase H-like nuclease